MSCDNEGLSAELTEKETESIPHSYNGELETPS